MKPVFKLLSAVCIFTLMIGILGGCQDKQANTTSDNSKTTAAKEAAKPKQVSLRFSWWGGESRHKATLDAINKYMEKNPNVKIEAEYQGGTGYDEKIATQIAGGMIADLVQLTPYRMNEFSKKNDIFVDFNQYKNVIDISGFTKSFLTDFCTVNNKLLALPTGINSLGLGLNKKVTDKAGVNLKGDFDWNKLLTEGKKVNQQNKDQYFMTGDSDLYYLLMEAYIRQKTGELVIKDDYTIGFDKASLVEAYTFLRKMFDEKVCEPMETAFPYKYEQNKKWLNGDIGCIPMWGSTFSQYKNNNVEFEAQNFPIMAGAKTTGIRTAPSQLFSVTKGPNKNPEETIKFLNYLYNDKEAILSLTDQRSVQPTENGRKICMEANKVDPVVNSAVTMALAKTDKPVSMLSENSELKSLFQQTTEAVAFGKVTPDKAADDLMKAFQQKLGELKSAAK